VSETTKIFENELLGYYFGRSGSDPLDIQRILGRDACDNLRSAIASELLEQAKRDDTDLVDFEVVSLSGGAQFNSILYRGGGYSGPRKIILFGFKGTFRESALPLLALVIAAATGVLGLASLPVAGAVIKAAWSKLEVLREPQDRSAILLLEALSAAKLRHKGQDGRKDPSWKEVLEQAPLDPQAAQAALKVLRTRSLVEISEWGDQTDDDEHPGNRWKVQP
jgi:hypothetical protein